MDYINRIALSIGAMCLLCGMQMAHAETKRFSVSAGWLHIMPQGTANPFNINTSVMNGTNSEVGVISTQAFLNSVDPDAIGHDLGNNPFNQKDTLTMILGDEIIQSMLTDGNGNLLPEVTGTATMHGLERWQAAGTGLEAEDADTLGLMFNYYLNDKVSLQLIGGIPPKVNIKGRGEIFANISGIAKSPNNLVQILFPDGIDIKQAIPITNLGNKPKASSVRAWTPAIEAQYQFGKSGVNKFRPYVGVGIMYSHFSSIKLDSQINDDLVAAGHMIQNVIDGKAGMALDGKTSNASPYVKVTTTDEISPIFTLGATYDFAENWFAVGSVSYAKLNNQVNINVIDSQTGNQLIRSNTKVDIDPLITYLGVGYRF